MAIFVTSDWHFNHNRDFVYQPRGFSCVSDMNKAIVERYNEVVTKDDDVYVLGDLMLNDDSALELIRSLPGKLHIVRGNHDTNTRMKLYETLDNVVEIENSIYLNFKGYHFYLSHFPTLTANMDIDKPLKQRTLNICGHTHTPERFIDMDKGVYHAEVDAHNCYPVDIGAVIKEFHSYQKQLNEIK